MAQSIKAAGGNVLVTVFPNEGHGVWGRYYPEPQFYNWLLKQKRTPALAAKSAANARTSAGAFRLVEREGGDLLDRRPPGRGRFVTSRGQ